MLASFVFCEICFVGLCEVLTMNYELFIAMSDSVNHLKQLRVQLKKKSECIYI